MRVGNDHDGCYSNFGEGVRNALEARELGHLWKSGPPHVKPHWNFYEEWGWTFEQFKELVDWGVDNRLIFSGQWRPGAIETMHRLRDMGHEVIFITDRFFGSDPKNSHRNTMEAFEEAGFMPDEVHFTPNKTEVDVDIMVEDKLENYDMLVVSGCPTFLINRSWNMLPGGDARNRINDITDYGDAVEAITKAGYAQLSFS